MNDTTVVIEGVVRADGTLELEGKVPLPAGRVRVTLEPVPALPEWLAGVDLPKGDPLFDTLRGIWAAQAKEGKPFRTGEEAQEALRRLRDEAAEEVDEIGRLQAECQRLAREGLRPALPGRALALVALREEERADPPVRVVAPQRVAAGEVALDVLLRGLHGSKAGGILSCHRFGEVAVERHEQILPYQRRKQPTPVHREGGVPVDALQQVSTHRPGRLRS